MSKYLKNLITEDLRRRLQDVDSALLVNVVGLDANTTHRLRGQLREKGIQLMVVKNSLARRATAGTPLGPMFEDLTGPAAICWGAEDIVSLAREVTRLAEDEQYEGFQTRGGVMDGQRLTPEEVKEVSKWPSRGEALAQLVGQIVGPGAALAATLGGPGALVASQLGKLAEKEESSAAAAEEGQ